MRLLVPYVVSCDIVDRYDIWVHTHNGADIAFFQRLASKYSKINLVWQPDGIVGGNETINPFYKNCIDEDAIYFKVDDDVIWMEENAIKKMVDFRIDNPEYFLVSPLVINNPLCTYALEASGKLRIKQYQAASPFGELIWKSGQFAYELHAWFIENYIHSPEGLYIGKKIIGANRLSINAILWFGKDFMQFGGYIPGDDEEYLSCLYPTNIGAANAINGECIMAHYAFFTQRTHLDSSNLLYRYDEWTINNVNFNPDFYECYNDISLILEEINSNEKELMENSSPYKKPKQHTKTDSSPKYSLKRFIIKHIKKKEYSPNILNHQNEV